MSGKIEISRELAEKLLQACAPHQVSITAAAKELRALLAAPVVERQPIGYGMEEGGQLPENRQSSPVAVVLDERAEFENYYRDRIMGNRTGVRFLRSASGSYLDDEVREMWSGWQARASLDKVKELNK